MQTDRAGYISKQELQEYLDQNNITADITSERVKLIDFLKKNQHLKLTLWSDESFDYNLNI